MQRQPSVQNPRTCCVAPALDVQRSFLRNDRFGDWRCAALDFKAAHQCVKVAPREQGTLLCEIEAQLYHYTVCHFGARFSAYWRARVGGLITRILRRMLQSFGQRAWLYVDDLLLLFRAAEHTSGTCVTVALLSILNAPVSWKKAQIWQAAAWCGWSFNFALETVRLREPKLLKLREQLARVARSKKTTRKRLEAVLGLLLWDTSACPRLRLYMAPLSVMRPARSSKYTRRSGSLFWTRSQSSSGHCAARGSLAAAQSQDHQAGVVRHKLQSKPSKSPSFSKSQWVRVLDPHRSEVRLRAEAKQALLWLATCFSHDRVRSMRQNPMLRCYAAADACADGDVVGIGGWFVSESHCSWFSEQWDISEIRELWPALRKPALRYIACFETLAQLALAMTARKVVGAQ